MGSLSMELCTYSWTLSPGVMDENSRVGWVEGGGDSMDGGTSIHRKVKNS